VTNVSTCPDAKRPKALPPAALPVPVVPVVGVPRHALDFLAELTGQQEKERISRENEESDTESCPTSSSDVSGNSSPNRDDSSQASE